MSNRSISLFVCMLLICTVFSVSATVVIKKTLPLAHSGNILYVGGSGSGNYSTIQGAVDNALDGDTVFVYDDSSPYYENVVIDNSISIIGEDPQTTIIDGGETKDHVVQLLTDFITLTGFTIRSCSGYFAGVGVKGENNSIFGNIITDNSFGIILFGVNAESNNNDIISNVISNNTLGGIRLDDVSYTTISDNKIVNNTYFGISDSVFRDGKIFVVSNNIIADHDMGVWLGGSTSLITNNIVRNNPLFGIRVKGDNNLVSNNTISDHASLMHAALVIDGFNNTVTRNNFLNNSRHAKLELRSITFREFLHTVKYKNNWDENYWGESGLEQKMIIGFQNIHIKILINLEFTIPLPIFIPKVNFDWNPVQIPHD